MKFAYKASLKHSFCSLSPISHVYDYLTYVDLLVVVEVLQVGPATSTSTNEWHCHWLTRFTGVDTH